MIFTSFCYTSMDLQTVPLALEYIKTPKIIVKTQQLDLASSSNDLFYM
jgi:hypothetical protein